MGGLDPVRHRTGVVVVLGATQTIAWASSYYLPAILAVPIARDIGVPVSLVFLAVSIALVIPGFLSAFAGRWIDRAGGRRVLAVSNVVFAGGLALLAASNSLGMVVAAWVVLGLAMSLGLYDAAFATLAGIYGRSARGPITGITLLAGFASTIGWPVHALLEDVYGWRAACFAWAAVHLLVCLPLNLALLPRPGRAAEAAAPGASGAPVAEAGELAPREAWRAGMLLAFVFAASSLVASAMASHLPRLLQGFGASETAAIAAGMLIGPAQVAARIGEFSLKRWIDPLTSARFAQAMHPVAGGVLLMLGAPAAAAFAVLHAIGNGLTTISRGVLPLAIFGAAGYGLRQGLIVTPSRFAQALAPFLYGLILDASPVAAVVTSGCLTLAALAALMALRLPEAAREGGGRQPGT